MAGECAVLDLVQVSTGKVVEARLEGVSQEELNQDDVGVFFGFINEAAKKDSSLPCTDCNGIRFEPPAQGRPPHEAIVSRLVVYSELIEVLIENDCMIKEKDKEVLHHTEETDSPGSFFSVIKGHLLDVLKYFFSFEKVMQCTPHKLLINLAVVFKYCYNFIKRMVEHARATLRAVLPEIVFNILCYVGAAVTRHLIDIKWRTILERVGGWVQLAGSIVLYNATKEVLLKGVKMPVVWFGAAGLCVTVGILTYWNNVNT